MQNIRPSIIAIDGPAASGKTTLGLRLAKALGYRFLDTGMMYRAVTWAVLQRGVDVYDEAAVTRVAEQVVILVHDASKSDGRTSDVLLDGQDITWETRRPEVNANVSPVAAYGGVRQAMVKQQQHNAEEGRIVMVGRDIGTVVVPHADLKIYLEASIQERARRRWEEDKAQGRKTSYEETLRQLQERDRIDSTRDVSPLRAADDAIVIDSDQLTIDQVFERVLKLCEPNKA